MANKNETKRKEKKNEIKTRRIKRTIANENVSVKKE